MAAKGKPRVYTYVATWDVPRAQWGDMAKLDEQDKPLLDKLVADGTLVGYGAYYNLIHQEGEPTHGSWFTATSEGNLLKALEAIYAQPGSVGAAVQGASKHWDQILTGDIYNAKAGRVRGLSHLVALGSEGGPDACLYSELTKECFRADVLEKLLADGSITSYGQLTEDYHTGITWAPFTITSRYPTRPPWTKRTRHSKKPFQQQSQRSATPMRALTEREGHRDFLTRLRYMSSK
jgi:hypothetical protein